MFLYYGVRDLFISSQHNEDSFLQNLKTIGKQCHKHLRYETTFLNRTKIERPDRHLQMIRTAASEMSSLVVNNFVIPPWNSNSDVLVSFAFAFML